jgi:hypothetical protein
MDKVSLHCFALLEMVKSLTRSSVLLNALQSITRNPIEFSLQMQAVEKSYVLRSMLYVQREEGLYRFPKPIK